ncbi:enoyl-CoA hydratase/isomerase family protein [Nocardioides daejeonensis]|uniref:enoyl-CoA hydratase/isomerase family protein n=1 Tax=Nocardioides daejeonensis TaxID=1046556 RepID=UPI000D740C65|nr:enoyl-CoA hydratase-related protein [Nocardioides daejeonensis]
MDLRTLRYDVTDGIATITLDRPARRNAFGSGMGRELAEAYRRCDLDDDVRVVVLTGAPPAFCAGADLEAGTETFAGTGEGFSAAGVRFPAFRVRKPVLAAVNGHAIGIGLTLALQCDVRVMAADAKYGVVQARLGLLGDAYVHWVLPRLVGVSRAAELLFTGRTFDGRQAEAWGLCSQVQPAAEVLPATLAIATEMAEAAPMSLAASKQTLWASLARDAAEVERLETHWHEVLMAHDDVREGMRAALERRPARWTGRVSDLP